MSNLKSLQTQVQRMKKVLLPSPKIINCSGAKEELLAMLQAQMTEEEKNEHVIWTEEDKQFIEQFDAFLDADIRQIEETCNVRLV
jgi:hypothetical protein